MKILAIDTSCDDTSVAILENDRILSNVISSQIEIHKKWGGVVPILAKRNHEEQIDFVVESALKRAGSKIDDVDIIAVTYGPGLSPALGVGVEKAKKLSEEFKKPIVAVNHMVGHIYSSFAKNSNGKYLSGFKEEPSFPLLILLISGGHTEIILMKDHLSFEKIGWTLDDSVGEAFDKVSNMLGWGYPGGPVIELFAKEGDEKKFDLPVPMKNSGDLNFSFSGLKTAVFRLVKKIGTEDESQFEKNIKSGNLDSETDKYEPSFSKKITYKVSKQDAFDVASSFQRVAALHLADKIDDALIKYPSKYLLLGGGVVNNLYIRKKLREVTSKYNTKLIYPLNKKLLTDNAGMIGVAGYYMAIRKQFTDVNNLDRKPSLSL